MRKPVTSFYLIDAISDQSKKRGSRGGGDNAQSRAAHNPMAINDINLSHNSSMNSNSTLCPSPSEEVSDVT